MKTNEKIWCVTSGGKDNWFATKREAKAYAAGRLVWKLVNGSLELVK